MNFSLMVAEGSLSLKKYCRANVFEEVDCYQNTIDFALEHFLQEF